MNAHAAFPAHPPTVAHDPALGPSPRARALAARQLAVLERLAEMGLAVAEAVEREVQARTPPAPSAAPDPAFSPPASVQGEARAPEAGEGSVRALQGLAMAYARTARAVRMTVLLQSKLMRELEAAEGLGETSGEANRRRAARRDAEQARKAAVARIVRRVAEGQFDDPETLDAYAEEACGRLDDEDLYGDVLLRPMGELVARICRDLDLDPDWSRLAQEAWAEAEIAAAPPGSPFAGLGASPQTRAGVPDAALAGVGPPLLFDSA
jgi:hypothetical protein